ncbi:MAG: transaldolase family protein [Anaerolineae bacterium]|nr:transaldolase family protein [Anaerolineae bacterium]
MNNTYNGPLHEMAATTPTDYWNDSCSVEELSYAIARGATGATTNPSIVLNVLKKEMHLWRERIFQLINEHPTWAEEDVAWRLIEEMAVHGARLLLPVFEREQGLKGRLSIQTNPTFYRNAEAITAQAIHFHGLAPNLQVKIPVTEAGLVAIEEATFHGVNINATVSFTVPQALAVAEAVERGLNRRVAAGHNIATMRPVCTLMIGRLDDWLHVLEKRDGILAPPGYADWAGIACFKKTYNLYQEHGYRARLLAAAYRHQLHWSELIGGDIVHSIPYEWQRKYNASGIKVRASFQEPAPPEIVNTLYASFEDFRRAYEMEGLRPAEFDTFGATVRTLRSFTGAYRDLLALVRDFMLPNPD